MNNRFIHNRWHDWSSLEVVVGTGIVITISYADEQSGKYKADIERLLTRDLKKVSNWLVCKQ
jgi:uncharacterized protein YlxW (UPF0749 family)